MVDIVAGIAGTGFIGPAHIEGLRRNNIKVLGLAEASAELAQKKAAELGIERAYQSFEAMIADPAIAVIHLATPNHLHYSQAKAAMLAGKHVICEKPLAMNTRESSELVELAAELHLVNAVSFNLRFYPISQQVRSMVRAGELGDVFIVQGSYLQDWLHLPNDWNWRLEPAVGGSLRAVADIGSHWLDLTTFVTGLRVESVMADFGIFHPVRKKPNTPMDTYAGIPVGPEDRVDQPIVTEDYASVLLHYTTGARGVVTVSQVSAGRKNRLWYEIDGAKGAVSFDSERNNELWIGHRDRPNELLLKDPSLLSPDARSVTSYPGGHNEGYPDTFRQFCAKVYLYIRRGDFNMAADFPTFADGHNVLRLCEAIETSAREGRWVPVR